MSQYPPIQIVDNDDQPIGAADMKEAHLKGLTHREVHIFVEDPAGRILLQKRSQAVLIFPGCWDVSAAGHVDEGESYEEAATRELKEELGISDYKLQELDSYYGEIKLAKQRLNRFVKVYKTVIPADTAIKPDPTEVAEVRWFDKAALNKLVTEAGDSLSPGMEAYFKQFHYL